MNLAEVVKKKIQDTLPGAHIIVHDESAAHTGHTVCGAHLAVEVTHAGFEGKTRVEQHQMIYTALKGYIGKEIHALKIKTQVN